jgi:hypothetical protein
MAMWGDGYGDNETHCSSHIAIKNGSRSDPQVQFPDDSALFVRVFPVEDDSIMCAFHSPFQGVLSDEEVNEMVGRRVE